MANLDRNSKSKKEIFAINYLDETRPDLEVYLQSLGLGFCREIKSDAEANAASLKNNRLRRMGFIVVVFSSLSFSYEIYQSISIENNFANMGVSFLCSLAGFFLMESASRATRMLEPLYLNKNLSDKFDTLARKSSQVASYKKDIKSSGRAARVFHISQANHLYAQEAGKENGGEAAI